MLHWLFSQVKSSISLWIFIAFWKRFIDDIFGLWLGTLAQFEDFVIMLNQASAPFGIKFGDSSVGTSVNFLDVTLSVNPVGLIDYQLYVKPTDSRLYLRTESFHPKHVFTSVALSQMLRVLNRNSTDNGKVRDLDQLESDLMKSGHKKTALTTIRENALLRHTTPKPVKREDNAVVCVVDYFNELNQLKTLLREMDDDLKHLVGDDVNIMVAARRCPTIRDRVVKNKQFITTDNTVSDTLIPCSSKRCMTCPIYLSVGSVIINSIEFVISKKFNCKTENCIYLAICNICKERGCGDNAYVGQTTQPLHKRMNGHRSCFVRSGVQMEKSALSLHAHQEHLDNFSLKNFSVTVLCQASPQALDRQESFYIEKFRTNTRGLNRMVVRR